MIFSAPDLPDVFWGRSSLLFRGYKRVFPQG